MLSELLSDAVFDVVGVGDNDEHSVAELLTVEVTVPEAEMECVTDAVRQTDTDVVAVPVWHTDTDGDIV